MQLRRRRYDRTVLAPGQILRGRDEYHVGEVIGEGGWAVVYAATSSSRQPVALKEFLPGGTVAERDQAQQFFRREREVLWRLRLHPHLPGLIEAFSQDGMRYLALEYVPGESLRERLDAGGPLPPDEAGPISLQLARAVAALHADGVVHHDVKPDNVKITATGLAVLLDLGSARSVHPIDAAPAVSIAQLAGDPIAGTAGYMAPEVREMVDAGALRSDPALDVFALGATMYELLTGKRLGQEAIDARDGAVLAAAVEEVRSLAPGMAGAVARALRPWARERFPSARELLADLSAAVAPKPATRRATLVFDVSAAMGEVEQTLVITNAGGGTLSGLVRSNLPGVRFRGPEGAATAELAIAGNLSVVRVLADAATAPAGAGSSGAITVHAEGASLDIECEFRRREVGPARLTANPTRVTLAITPQIVQQIAVRVRNEGGSPGRVLATASGLNLVEVTPLEAYLFPGTEAEFRVRPLLGVRSGTHRTEVVFSGEASGVGATVAVTVRASGSPWGDISHRLFRHRN